MSHNCGSSCKRKTGDRCETCRRPGGRVVLVGKDESETRHHATPERIGAAVDMYFDGLSYRRTAETLGEHLGRETDPMTVYRWVHKESEKAKAIVQETKVDTGDEWVADEVQVRVGGEKYWIFNVMDSKTRFLLAAYLSKERTTRAAQTAMAMARERAKKPPKQIKTDGLRSYKEAIPRAFPTSMLKHVTSKGIKAEINNNLSERLQGTIRDRDKTLRGLKSRESGQGYIDGLVVHYNYSRPHNALKGKKPAEQAGAELPFDGWADVARMDET